MRILVAGDFCPQNRVAKLIEGGVFSSVFSDIKDVINNADYSIVNLECPVTQGREKPLLKNGKNLHCSEKGVEALKWVGFNCVTLANNHFLDYGEEGVMNTITSCRLYGLDIVGGGINLHEANKILYKRIRNKTLAIINCCEHEFSIATDNTGGSSPLNPICQYYYIKEAKKNADFVLIVVHGGHEMWQLPSPRMKETYRYFIDVGADAVVNHHQHCYSGYEIYQGKPIVYGLGNFCFDCLNYFEDLWVYGCLTVLDMSEEGIRLELIPYKQCKETPKIELLKDIETFNNSIEKLNAIITNDNRLKFETERYYEQEKRQTQSSFELYYSKLSSLFIRGWLPSMLSKRKILKLLNMIQCEAHRDKVLFFLNHSYD